MPQDLKELYTFWQNREKETLCLNKKRTLNFSIKSFQMHRPIGRVMIVLMGQSGSGKSATINNLFDDKELCGTPEMRSATCEVTEYTKLIDLKNITLKGYLSLVDTPGTFTSKEEDEINMTKIREFRSKHSAFWTKSNSIVYPNLVLVTVRAYGTCIDDCNSFFGKTLRVIKETHLLDFSRINLIIAVTGAAAFDHPCEGYFQNIEHRITEIVSSVLGIPNVGIVFVENEPEKFFLQKKRFCNFYELPDGGELTPLNLFKAISHQLKSQGDLFGSLIISRYFIEDCQEKKEKATRKTFESYMGPDEISQCVLNTAFENLINFFPERWEEDNIYISSVLQFAGFGYSLIDESKKSCVISDSVCPRCETYVLRDKRLHKIIFANVKEYKKYRLRMYGLDSETEVKFSPNSIAIGTWRKDSYLRNCISYFFEERLGTIMFGDGLQRNSLVQELQSDLVAVPRLASSDGFVEQIVKQNAIRALFDKWGTHYIKEMKFGGLFRVDCCISSEWTDEQKRDLEGRIESKIASLVNQYEFKGDFEKMVGYNPVRIEFYGGIQSTPTKLSEVTPAMFAEWENSLKIHPVELENTMKLESYDVFFDGEYKSSFKAATLAHLKGFTPKLTTNQIRRAKAFGEKILLSALLVVVIVTLYTDINKKCMKKYIGFGFI